MVRGQVLWIMAAAYIVLGVAIGLELARWL
jgi:hypothetical protein